VTFGLNPKADIFASDIKLWPGKPVFKLNISGKVIEIKLPVYGQHNIMNALCAAAAVKALGLDTELIKFGLEKFVSPKMRMEVKTLMNGVTLINDAYNANPSSMREAVKGLSEAFPDRDKVVVLGDMLELGGSSAQEHAELGKFLDSQPLSRIFLLGEQMQNAMEPLNNTKAVHFMKKEDLTAELKVSIPQGAVVLFKASRGMKLEEVIDNLFPNEETA
jgi:UDP-N-acetylmuramoyl-tripeptide--D-alanyl-D-alanine ligase